jgi:hypothetical protein
MKRALSPNSQAAAEILTKMKKVKENATSDTVYMQLPDCPAVTQEWDVEVDSNYAAQEHRCDGSPVIYVQI